MIEQGLVYIHSIKPARRFVGCGALVEGGYVATCRHVWRMATDAAARAEPNQPLNVEVEFPRARQEGGGTVRRAARLVDACDSAAKPAPDLVLLLPEEIPTAGVMRLRLASHERFQVDGGMRLPASCATRRTPTRPAT
jgi:hypothetical protein